MQRPVIALKGKEPRRRHSVEFKQRVVEQTLKPGASVARIARINGVNANQVFGWRKLYLEGQLGELSVPALLPVTIMQEMKPVAVADRAESSEQAVPARLRIDSPRAV